MRKRSLSDLDSEQLNIYQSFTDLMSNAFMILSLFLLIALLASQQLNKKLLDLNQRLQSASPIIIDEKSAKFQFKSGSAELTPELKNYILNDIAVKIKEIVSKHNIDYIQVIGHTDGQGMQNISNLDDTLELVAKGSKPVTQLQPGSNADLALMRALAVVQELEKISELKNVEFRAYSAAQLYLPSGELAPINRNPDQSRRRMEIRFIPPGKQE